MPHEIALALTHEDGRWTTELTPEDLRSADQFTQDFETFPIVERGVEAELQGRRVKVDLYRRSADSILAWAKFDEMLREAK